MSDAPAAPEAEAAPAPSGPKLPLILGLVNTVAVLAAMGALLYTRVLYKRPAITETTERARIAKEYAKPSAPAESGFVNFEPAKINIAAAGKMHYALIGFQLEIRDITKKGEVEKVRPLIMDRFLGIVGRKEFHELTNVQGRYVLKTQILDAINTTIRENAGRIQAAPDPKKGGEGGEHGGAKGHEAAKEAPLDLKEDLATNLYFTDFTVQ